MRPVAGLAGGTASEYRGPAILWQKGLMPLTTILLIMEEEVAVITLHRPEAAELLSWPEVAISPRIVF